VKFRVLYQSPFYIAREKIHRTALSGGAIVEVTVDEFTSRFGALAKQFPSSSDLAVVLQSMSFDSVPAGTRLIEYDGPCSTLYLVWDGLLSASLNDGGGKIMLGQIGPGEWIGEVTLIEPGPASATVSCTEDSTLLSMSHETFNKLRNDSPAAAGALMHALSLNLVDRLRAYGKRAAHEIAEGEYALEELAPRERTAIITLIARLMGIKGAK
jgi:CRP/FNR family cyclic AMP-dependent transcriptional regulator